MSIVEEFKAFALKGNVIDMAVGLVVGAAFNKIVTSLVNDVVMPPIGMLLGGVDFKNLRYVLKPAVIDAGKETVPEVAIRFGMFFNTVIEFFIIALSVFVMVKVTNRLMTVRLTQMAELSKTIGGKVTQKVSDGIDKLS